MPLHTEHTQELAHGEQGNILFSALLILLVMNLLAIGLVQASMKESKIATYKSVNSSVFHVTESCIRDAVKWLSATTRPTDLTPHTISQPTLDHWLVGGESSDVVTRMNGYSYSCTITELISKSMPGTSEGTGEVIGDNAGYGTGSDMSPKYFYQVDASGIGPDGATKQIISLVSVTY